MADLMGDDPAAEFLQQEEDQLRELGIDADPLFDQPSVEVDAGDGFLVADYPDELGGGVDDVGDIGDIGVSEPMMDGFMDEAPAPEPMAASIPEASPPPVEPVAQSEPESLQKWRDEKAALLSQQEEDEQNERQAWLDNAKKELEDWNARYNEQLEKVRNENRTAEALFIEEMTDNKPGNEWEKAARFCEFNPKNSKNTKDVSRMRSLLLQLKQTPLER